MDTIYYNYKWQVCEKPFAEYYRLGVIVADSFWHYTGKVQDFYIGGGKQMEGAYSEKGYKNGLFSFYYGNGKTEAQGNYRSGLIYGFWDYYYPNGSKKARVFYSGDESSFVIMDYTDSTGKILTKDGTGNFEISVNDYYDGTNYRLIGEIVNGDRNGTWNYYIHSKLTNKEELLYKELYDNGQFKSGNTYSRFRGEEKNKALVLVSLFNTSKFLITESFSVDETKAAKNYIDPRQSFLSDSLSGYTRDSIGAYRNVEIEASFPGGIRSWSKFLERTLNPNAGLKDVPRSIKSFTQTVWVQFIVCTDGTVCNVETMNEVLPSLKKEAERVIKLSGKWVPAIQNGNPVKAYRKQPITFQYFEE